MIPPIRITSEADDKHLNRLSFNPSGASVRHERGVPSLYGRRFRSFRHLPVSDLGFSLFCKCYTTIGRAIQPGRGRCPVKWRSHWCRFTVSRERIFPTGPLSVNFFHNTALKPAQYTGTAENDTNVYPARSGWPPGFFGIQRRIEYPGINR